MAKKADDEWKKRDLRCHAILCGREMSLKADGVVAGYLADRLFNPPNDTSTIYLGVGPKKRTKTDEL
jgi:hypothetical protein